ncbi:hypothetical protein QAD02_003738 [Eretmocerus hayati]|uniref:Uncharacterized protein n=1 Tax=Eretmocerus hayati TaxID=131215 RepID=A0ACC2NN07_9HYME|nr:hypothetical protein QAD02_003738 [Eretmocerus hayati]
MKIWKLTRNVLQFLQILELMTDQEFYQVFHSERAEAPAHEFVKLNSPSTTQLKRKSSSENRVLSFTAFGHFYDLLLKPRDGVLIGKDTPVWHVQTNPLNSSQPEYTRLPDVMNNLNGIYQDTENMISLIENKFETSGESYYDGMIAPDLAISPIPRRLVQMMSNSTNANTMEDHVIFKISADNVTIDYEPSDNVLADKRSNQNIYRLFPLRTFYPEILVVVDLSLYSHLGYEPDLAMNYIVPFWNGVDLRYKLLETPQVKLNIAGVILAQDETALQFIFNNLDESGRIHAKEAILDAGEYFDTNAEFITKDVIVTMTK